MQDTNPIHRSTPVFDPISEKTDFPSPSKNAYPPDFQKDTIETPCICSPIIQFFSDLFNCLYNGVRTLISCCISKNRSDLPPPNLDEPEEAIPEEKHTPISSLMRYPIPLPENAPERLHNLPKSYISREKTIPVSQNEITEKYWKNSRKAFAEHRNIPLEEIDQISISDDKALNEHRNAPLGEIDQVSVSDNAVYYLGSSLEGIQQMAACQSAPQFKLEHAVAEAKGTRPTMEDAHLFDDITYPTGTLAAVFDGHNGSWVSEFAAGKFSEIFSHQLQLCADHIPLALELSLESLHEAISSEIHEERQSIKGGSTAVVCYIDRTHNLVYTATLGDSEANIYREIDGHVRSIPLSCVRHWLSKKDFGRLQHWFKEYLDFPNLTLSEKDTPKNLKIYSKSWCQGLNVSRSLGDVAFGAISEGKFIGTSQKPKITIHPLQPGDRLILACDGLKDFVPETEIAATVAACSEAAPQLANALVQKAFDYNTRDNVTVLAIDVLPSENP